LLVAGTVFFSQGIVVKQLEDAHNLLEGILDSELAPHVFGLGLFCAGQSSTLTGTMAGQIVMEGFLQMKMRPWLRRLITRCVAVLPAVVVIAIFGNDGTYKMLIFSQVPHLLLLLACLLACFQIICECVGDSVSSTAICDCTSYSLYQQQKTNGRIRESHLGRYLFIYATTLDFFFVCNVCAGSSSCDIMCQCNYNAEHLDGC
jgi:Mn2+/Fe2+ NRAMP family transporter